MIFFYDELVTAEIVRQQEIDKEKVINAKSKNIYTLAYNLFERIAEHYGVNTTLNLAQLVFDYIPIYHFDLIKISKEERISILDNYFNLDKTWMNILNVNPNEIFESTEYTRFNDHAPLAVCGYKLEQLSMVDIESKEETKPILDNCDNSLPESVYLAFKRIYLNPCVIDEIEKLTGRKINLSEMLRAIHLAQQFANTPESINTFDFVKDKETCIVDERIKRFPELLYKSPGVYANKHIQKVVSAMDSIISISEKQ